MAESMDSEQFELLRRKNLYELQEAAANYRTEGSVWKYVFRRADTEDGELIFMWVPRQPYESLLDMARRTEEDAARMAQKAVCKDCRYGMSPQFGGFTDDGSEIWNHERAEFPKPSWMDSLMARLGYSKEIDESKVSTVQFLCPASPIIRAFRLIKLPELPGVNTGAYPGPSAPYGDPEAGAGYV
jgi:hypothetical protein